MGRGRRLTHAGSAIAQNVKEKGKNEEDIVGRKVASQENRAHSLPGKMEGLQNGVVKEDENRASAWRFTQNMVVDDLGTSSVTGVLGMESRDHAIKKGVPRKWERQRGALGWKNL